MTKLYSISGHTFPLLCCELLCSILKTESSSLVAICQQGECCVRTNAQIQNLTQMRGYLHSVLQLSVANYNFESPLLCIFISLFSKLYTKQIFICLCMNMQLRKTLPCQHEGQPLYIYHCLMSIIAQQINSLSWQHNYIFTFTVEVILCRYVHVSVCVCVVYLCLCLSSGSLHSTPLLLVDASKAPCSLTPDEPETSATG